MQNFAEKKRVSLCSANATFPVIPKRCCLFSVVESFQFEFTGQTFVINWLKIQPSWVLMLYYPYKMMYSAYKTMYSAYRSVIVSPCACDLFVSKVMKITRYMDVYFWRSFFWRFFRCVMTVSWNQPQPGCWNYVYIHSFMQVHNTTFQIKTVFNNVLFSTEVHNPLHAHLLALSHRGLKIKLMIHWN